MSNAARHSGSPTISVRSAGCVALSSVSFCKDDVLVLLSDGYAELHNEQGEMMGYEKPAEILSKAGCAPIDEIIAHFRKAADEWTDSSSPNDDMTFVVVKRNGD